ncbi:MAG TPA: DUF2079 domain-containing protein, partial [Candidatus Nitrosotalea sp.]|nr:DUF2079 domain-containing protein [Candidatus Nitrosotalea sp.]
ALLIAATIIPLWGIAAARLPKWLAFATTLVAATYPPLSSEAIGDFHELAFAPPLAATIVWAIDRKAWRIAVLAAAVLATVKEDQFVSLAFVGLVTAIIGRKDRQMCWCGVWIAAIAVGAAIFYFGILRPAIDPHFPYFSLDFYQWGRVLSSPAGFAELSSPLRAQYLFAVLLPLAFLPLGSRYVLFAIPGLVEVLSSHEAITILVGAHYTANWSGYLLAAFVDGTSNVYRRAGGLAQLALTIAFVASVWTSAKFSPVNPQFALYRQPAESDRARERELNSLPRTASVGTGGFILAHLGMNPHSTIAMSDQDYLVFDAFSDPQSWRNSDAAKVAQLVSTGAYAKVFDGDGIVVLKRR